MPSKMCHFQNAAQIILVKDQINFLDVNTPWLSLIVTVGAIALGMKVYIILCGHGLDELQMVYGIESPRKPGAALEMGPAASPNRELE